MWKSQVEFHQTCPYAPKLTPSRLVGLETRFKYLVKFTSMCCRFASQLSHVPTRLMGKKFRVLSLAFRDYDFGFLALAETTLIVR